MDEEKRKRLRKNVLDEIVSSEDKYLRDLYILTVYFIYPIRKDKRFANLFSNSKADLLMLFSTVDLIFDSNTELLDRLKEETSLNVSDPMVGQVFCRTIDKLCQYYGVFCNHQKEAMNQIEDLLKTSPQFKSFDETCKKQAECAGLGLVDYLVKPFQRLLKYPLLLKELLKLTSDDHPDKASIETALDKLQTEVDFINKTKAKNDSMKKMLDICQAVEALPRGFKLLTPSRVLLFDGNLRKISGNHDQERYCILFNDCFVYCKKKGPNKYIFRGVIYLSKLSIVDMNDVAFKIIRSDKNLTYIMYASSKASKVTWMSEIQKCQDKGIKPSTPSNTSVVPGVKKEIIRVYITSETFKSVAVTFSTTVKEVGVALARKMNIVGSFHLDEFMISAWVDGKETKLSEEDKPLGVQNNYIKQGIKFGDEKNHFILANSVTSPNPLMTNDKSKVTPPTKASPIAPIASPKPPQVVPKQTLAPAKAPAPAPKVSQTPAPVVNVRKNSGAPNNPPLVNPTTTVRKPSMRNIHASPNVKVSTQPVRRPSIGTARDPAPTPSQPAPNRTPQVPQNQTANVPNKQTNNTPIQRTAPNSPSSLRPPPAPPSKNSNTPVRTPPNPPNNTSNVQRNPPVPNPSLPPPPNPPNVQRTPQTPNANIQTPPNNTPNVQRNPPNPSSNLRPPPNPPSNAPNIQRNPQTNAPNRPFQTANLPRPPDPPSNGLTNSPVPPRPYLTNVPRLPPQNGRANAPRTPGPVPVKI